MGRETQGHPRGQTQATVGSSVSSGGKDQSPSQAGGSQGGGSRGEGARDGHKGPTATTVLTPRPTTAVISRPFLSCSA